MNDNFAPSPIDSVLSRLERVKQTGDRQWQAQCPAHEDRKPSLSVGLGDDGRVLLDCKAGCTCEEVCHAIGFQIKDLFMPGKNQLPPPAKKGKPKKIYDGLPTEWQGSPIVCWYDYRDETGQLAYKVARAQSKEFPPLTPAGEEEKWSWGMNGVKPILYRFPELLQGETQQIVFLPEGEKDVDNLHAMGLTATTNVGGAGKWRDEYSRHLEGRLVVILPDNDSAGRNHARKVAMSLYTVAAEVRILELPGLPAKGDVSDWLKAGGTKESLLQLAQEAPLYDPTDIRVASENRENPVDSAARGRPWALTDMGRADRMVYQNHGVLRFCAQRGEWLIWDNKRWKVDETLQIVRYAKKTAESMWDEVKKAPNSNIRIELSKFAHESQKQDRLAAMINLAKCELPVTVEQLNADPWLLNCLNGTLNLQTGQLCSHRSGDLLTKIIPVMYDPAAELPMWDAFLDTTTGGDVEMMVFLQTAMGYSLSGNTGEEKLFFIHGPAASGKSTFMESVKSVMGDYAATSDFESFLERSQTGGPRNDIARLAGARLVVSIEVDDGKRLAEGLIKMMTGGDKVAARFLYKESFEFVPQFKLWLAANHAPRVDPTDQAMWRRILRVPFEQVIPEEKRDPVVKATLRNPKAAGAAILAWAVRGFQLWREKGLIVPQGIKQATEQYRQDQDPLKDFFEDRCVFEEFAIVSVAQLRQIYDEWAKENGYRFPLSSRSFNERLRALGCEAKTTWHNGQSLKCWHGIGLQNQGDDIPI